MKKQTAAILSAVVFAATAANAVHAASAKADKISVKSSVQTVKPGETFYVSVAAFDADAQPISDAKPLIKASPSYMVETGNFVNCATAEGVETCSKMDKDLAHVDAAYVVPVTAKDQTGNVKLDVYVDSKTQGVSVSVGGVSATAAAAPKEEAKAAAEVKPEDVKAGGKADGAALAAIGTLLAAVAAISGRKRKTAKA